MVFCWPGTPEYKEAPGEHVLVPHGVGAQHLHVQDDIREGPRRRIVHLRGARVPPPKPRLRRDKHNLISFRLGKKTSRNVFVSTILKRF